MLHLRESEIISFVRTRIAELSAEASDMFLDETDDRNLDATILGVVEESVSYVHQKAASNMLEGETVTQSTTGVTKSLNADGSVDITLGERKVLRLVSFKMAGSPIVLTEVVDEDSPKGRMQLNEYAKGTFDEPVLVVKANSADYKPQYVYYSVESTATAANIQFSLSYYPVPERKTEETNVYSWLVSTKLKEAVLNQVTGMTLRCYKDEVNAAPFFARCTEYLQ